MVDNIAGKLTDMVQNVSRLLPDKTPEREEREEAEREAIRRRNETSTKTQ